MVAEDVELQYQFQSYVARTQAWENVVGMQIYSECPSLKINHMALLMNIMAHISIILCIAAESRYATSS